MELRPPDPIVTARLRFRPLTLADVPDLLTCRGDPRVCRYLPFEPTDEETLTARLLTDLGRRAITAEGQYLTLGVELAGTGRVIGDVVVFLTSVADTGGEVGYVFSPDVAGHGYATEASAALLDWAFDPDGMALHRVVARMDARNTASARVAARLGMRVEAHHVASHRFKGEWADLVVCAVLEHEWRGGTSCAHSTPARGSTAAPRRGSARRGR